MELVEHTREPKHNPGRYSSFDRFSVQLTRNKDTGSFWKYSKVHFKEKQIQKVTWGEVKSVRENTIMEIPILVIHGK